MALRPPVGVPANGGVRCPAGRGCSTNATCRHEFAVNAPVLSYDMPSRSSPEPGTSFHSLQATSHALQPMQTLVSVKKPIRGGASVQPASGAGSNGPDRLFGSGSITALPGVVRGGGAAPGVIVGAERPGTMPARRW